MKIKRARPKVSIRFPLPDILAATKNLYLVHALSILLYFSLSLSSPLTCYQLPARYLRVDVSKNSFNEEFEDEEEEDGKRLARDCSTLFPFRLMRFIYIMEYFVSFLFFFLMILSSRCDRFNVFM